MNPILPAMLGAAFLLLPTTGFAEARLDTSSAEAQLASLKEMTKECGESEKAQCIPAIYKAISTYSSAFRKRRMKNVDYSAPGFSYASPSYMAKVKKVSEELAAEMNGWTRAELLQHAAAVE